MRMKRLLGAVGGVPGGGIGDTEDCTADLPDVDLLKVER